MSSEVSEGALQGVTEDSAGGVWSCALFFFFLFFWEGTCWNPSLAPNSAKEFDMLPAIAVCEPLPCRKI